MVLAFVRFHATVEPRPWRILGIPPRQGGILAGAFSRFGLGGVARMCPVSLGELAEHTCVSDRMPTWGAHLCRHQHMARAAARACNMSDPSSRCQEGEQEQRMELPWLPSRFVHVCGKHLLRPVKKVLRHPEPRTATTRGAKICIKLIR